MKCDGCHEEVDHVEHTGALALCHDCTDELIEQCADKGVEMGISRDEALKNPVLKAALEKAEARAVENWKALAAVEAGDLQGALDGAAEKQVVAEIIAGLEQMGYRKPSQWTPGCNGIYLRVGQRKAKGSGTEVGCPDLWICPLATMRWAAFEIKARTKKAVVSKEQNTLQKLGIIRVVNTAKEVFDALRFEGANG